MLFYERLSALIRDKSVTLDVVEWVIENLVANFHEWFLADAGATVIATGMTKLPLQVVNGCYAMKQADVDVQLNLFPVACHHPHRMQFLSPLFDLLLACQGQLEEIDLLLMCGVVMYDQ